MLAKNNFRSSNTTVQNDLLHSFTGYYLMKEVIALKKRIFPILLILIMVFTSPAYAASTRAAAATPHISFDGTTASCSVFIAADRPTDKIDAVIKLWHGSECIETWEKSSVGELDFKGKVKVTKGQTYQLTVDITLAGKAQPRLSVEKTCK